MAETNTRPDEPPNPARSSSRLRTLDAFAYREFRFLWSSNLSYFTGVWMQTLVMGWLVYEVTHSTFLLAVFTAARLLPMVLGPIGGLVSDRVDRLKLLIQVQVFVFGVSIVLAFLASADRIEYWHLLLAGFLIGATQAPVQPARNTLIMDIVSRDDVSNAVALNAIAMSVTRVIGPAAGGILLGRLGAPESLWLSAVWYVVGIVTLIPIRHVGRGVQVATGRSPLRDLSEGFRIVLGHRTMRIVVFVSLLANIFAWPVYQAFMPVFAEDVLNVGPEGLGALLTASGIGAVLGAMFIASLGNFKWKGQAYIWGTALFGISYTLFAWTDWLPGALVFMFFVGVGGSVFSVLQVSLLLLLSPPEARGRAMGVETLAIGILPVSTMALGIIAEDVGVVTTTAFSGLLLFGAMVALFVLAPNLRRAGQTG